MKIFKRLFEKRADKIDPKHPRDPALTRFFRFISGQTDSGVVIDAENAPETVAVMSCVRVLSETLSSLPFVLYRRIENDGKEKDRDHHLFDILRYQPNAWQSWFEFLEMMTAHILLRGNAYAEKVYKNGKISQLIPLHPDRVTPFLVNGARVYKYRNAAGGEHTYLQDEIFYIPGLSFDGVSGLDPISYARHAIGLARATEKFGGRFFTNDATPGLIIQHPGPTALSDKAYDNLKKSLDDRHRGADKSHKPMILEEGMTVDKIGIPPENAQFLETRKFQRTEIAGFFRVPAHLINDLEKSTFSNIENLGRQFVDYTLLPWFVRIEQAARRDLLDEKEKKTHVIEFNPAALLRGDLKTRYESYAIGRNNGFLSANDIRRKENMNPIQGGDTYLQALNMEAAGDNPDDPAEPDPEPEQESDDEE